MSTNFCFQRFMECTCNHSAKKMLMMMTMSHACP